MPRCVLRYITQDGTIAIVSGASKAELERVVGPLTDDAYVAMMASKISKALLENLEALIIMDDWQDPSSSS